MSELEQAVVSLFSAFNRREVEEVVALCAEDVRFEAATAEFAGREGAYAGREGMRDYFHDVASVWDELLITPRRILARGDGAVAFGRIFARGPNVGLRDLPIAWLFAGHDRLFTSIVVYEDRLAALSDWERGAPG
jgi:ketosteroid isomerase-like protein